MIHEKMTSDMSLLIKAVVLGMNVSILKIIVFEKCHIQYI